ncbi:MAG: acyltransferase [Bacillota bacterium]
MNRNKIYEFDIMRTIAAYAVIMIHVSAVALSLYEPQSSLGIITFIFNRFLKFATPVFIYISGVMVYIKYKKRDFSALPFFKDRAVRILIPYAVFTLFYYTADAYFYGTGFTLKGIVQHLIFGTGKYHLYFIPIIMQMYLITPALIKLRDKIAGRYAVILSFFVTLFTVMYVVFPYSDRVFVKYLFYYMMGVVFGDRILVWMNSRLKCMLALAAAAAVGTLFVVLSPYDHRNVLWVMYTSVSVFSIFAASSLLKNVATVRSVSTRYAPISFYVYLVHPALLALSDRILVVAGVSSISLRFLINALFTILTSSYISKYIVIIKDMLMAKFTTPEKQAYSS